MTSRRLKSWAPLLGLGALAGILLAGCGGGTKTVSVSSSAQASTAATQPTVTTRSTPAASHPPTTTKSQASPTETTGTTAAGGTAAGATGPSTTRTAPEPAFTNHGGGTSAGEAAGSEVAAAVAAVKAQGYTPNDAAEYHPHQTLTVLLGTRTGSADGYDQRAFFFEDGRYIGTDSSQPSASMRVVSQGETEVVIAYALYRSHDPLCCPSGGQATVHFQLDDGQLTPLQPIPPTQSATGLSRQ